MKTRMLVVDDNYAMVEMIKEYFKSNKNIEIAYEAHDGVEALDIIEKYNKDIDIILLDLIMPKKDGFSVLQYMSKKKISNNVIVLTSYNEPDTIRSISQLGAKYYILKPFDLDDLEKKITELRNNMGGKISIDFHTNSIEKNVTSLLHELGMPSHIKGYIYIRDAVTLVYKKPELIGGITKELYPLIASRFETSSSRVERAIRHAIEVSWNRADWNLMINIFGNSVDIDRAKPTNSEFIVTIADKLRLDMIQIK